MGLRYCKLRGTELMFKTNCVLSDTCQEYSFCRVSEERVDTLGFDRWSIGSILGTTVVLLVCDGRSRGNENSIEFIVWVPHGILVPNLAWEVLIVSPIAIGARAKWIVLENNWDWVPIGILGLYNVKS